jgi:hypothetical protein
MQGLQEGNGPVIAGEPEARPYKVNLPRQMTMFLGHLILNTHGSRGDLSSPMRPPTAHYGIAGLLDEQVCTPTIQARS